MNTKNTDDRKLLVDLTAVYISTFVAESLEEYHSDPQRWDKQAVDFAVNILEIIDSRLDSANKLGQVERAPLPDWVEWLPRDDKMVLFTKPKAGVKHTLVIVSRKSTGWIYNVYTPQDERHSFRSEGVFNTLEYAQTFAERDVDWDGWLAVYSEIV